MQVGRYRDVLLCGLLAILAFVTATENEPAVALEERNPIDRRWELHTTLKCTTTFAPTPGPVAKTTTTINTISRKTVSIKTVRSGKTTVKDPAKTTTITKTFRSTRVITHSTVWWTVIAWSRTVTSQWSLTATVFPVTRVLTPGVFVTTLTSTTTVQPGPGFTAVWDDPYNAKASAPPWPDKLKARAPANNYPKKIYCTKTLKTVYSVIGTKTVPTSTVKVAGKTSTRSSQVGPVTTSHFTPGNAKISTYTSTATGTTTAYRTSTVTSWQTRYTYSTTSTTYAPRATSYAACGARNQLPMPSDFSSVWFVGAQINSINKRIEFNGTVVDCCAMCQSLPASQGKCLGSYWLYDGPFGWDPCLDHDPPTCGEPDHIALCFLMLANTAGTCNHGTYVPNHGIEDFPGAVNNGPNCAYWRLQT